MRTYRISGTNRATGRFEIINVQGIDHCEAMQLMAMTHTRMVCFDKRGVE